MRVITTLVLIGAVARVDAQSALSRSHESGSEWLELGAVDRRPESRAA